jgi:hypothetical protein
MYAKCSYIVRAMSIHTEQRANGVAYVVRYRQDGRHRSRAFPTKKEAQTFDRALKAAKRRARQAESDRLLRDFEGGRF